MAAAAEPDLAGFAEAQGRLRDHFGEVVVLLRPTAHSWPSGTPLDPESGEPFDPVLAAQGSASMASAQITANIAERPFGRADVEWTNIGARETDDVMLIADVGASAALASATRFEARGTHYEMRSWRFDGIGGIQRAIAFGTQR